MLFGKLFTIMIVVGVAAFAFDLQKATEGVRAPEKRIVPGSPPRQPLCRDARLIARVPELGEASGLALSRRTPDLLWTHNDSGDPVVYGLGVDGTVRARVHVTNAEVEDWEDIAAADCPRGPCLYVGDIGDNHAVRKRITVYRIPEPVPGDRATPPVETFHAVYPDRAQDAEGLFVTLDGGVFVVTKGDHTSIGIYRFPAPLRPGTTVRLEPMGTLTAGPVREPARVTDAEVSTDGRWVVLRTAATLAFYRAANLTRGAPSVPLAFDLAGLHEPQGEGVALARDGTVYLAGESRSADGGTLARLSCMLPN